MNGRENRRVLNGRCRALRKRMVRIDISGRAARVMHVLEACLGGTRRYLENIAACAQDLGTVNALVYSPVRADAQFWDFLEAIIRLGWDVFEVPMVRPIRPAVDAGCVWKLRSAIQRFRPDILHCHSSKAGALGRIAAFMSNPRPLVLYSPHSIAVNLGRRYFLAEKLLAGFTDRFVAVSHSEREELVGLGLAGRDKIDVVYPILEADHFVPLDKQEVRRALNLPSVPLIVAVGRMAVQKDPIAFLRVVRRVRDLGLDAHALWVGDGELRKDFDREVEENNLQGVVRVVGWQHDVRPFIAAADVVLTCARHESFGFVVAEALAMERPVVATHVTGTVDVMTGPLARYLYRPGDYDAAANLVLGLLSDIDTARNIARLGREQVRSAFSVIEFKRQLAHAYNNGLLQRG